MPKIKTRQLNVSDLNICYINGLKLENFLKISSFYYQYFWSHEEFYQNHVYTDFYTNFMTVFYYSFIEKLKN